MQNDIYQSPVAFYQTAFLPSRGTSPLFITTLPKAELTTPQQPLQDFVMHAFRTPQSTIMASDRWMEISRRLKQQGLIEEASDWHLWLDWHGHPSLRLHVGLRRWYEREGDQLNKLVAKCRERPDFARAFIRGLIGYPPSVVPARRAPALERTLGRHWLGWPPIPSPLFPAYWAPSPLAALHLLAQTKLDELQLLEHELTNWIGTTWLLLCRVPGPADEFASDLLDQDIPYASSKQSEKASLSRLFDQARMVIYFPLAGGAVAATNQALLGNPVMAAEIMLGGAVITVLLASTVSLTEWILSLPLKRKGGAEPPVPREPDEPPKRGAQPSAPKARGQRSRKPGRI